MDKAPNFILEIPSESTANADHVRKRELHAESGACEHWRYDATGGEFYGGPRLGERLVDGKYSRIVMRRESDDWALSHSEALNLDLSWANGELQSEGTDSTRTGGHGRTVRPISRAGSWCRRLPRLSKARSCPLALPSA